ncbi:MAG: DUF4445 domain-containing protein [Bacteroidales bacterium]|nr:DUF4445 domain-containing protein [Bacteroidales bacterium]
MKNKHTVRLEPLGKILKINPGTPLMDVLHEFGVEFPCGGKGSCLNCRVRILEGDLDTPKKYIDILQQNGYDSTWRLACKSKVRNDVILEIAQLNTLILADNTFFSFTPADGFGIAIDLGTTTVVLQLINLSNGHVMDAVTAVNVQGRYGSDIISRIAYARNRAGLKKLCQLIRKQLWNLIQGVIKQHDLIPRKVVMVGNTVMHHIFSGIDVGSLACFPFETRDGGKKMFRASELGWELPDDTRITFMPSVGSFVGSDILAGILATGINTSIEPMALIDLGTNGEVVVGNRDLILTASTAAGPAFEGTHISQGMRAANGAISSVFLRDDKLEFHVIGNEKPHGICGSGLIDAVSAFQRMGQIDEVGQITTGESCIEIAAPVKLTQKDIHEFILAKAAVAAGIQILLNRIEKSFVDLKRVFIAGGFGHFVTVSNAISTGLLEFNDEQVVKAGNTALIGAKMLLFREDDLEAEVLKKTRHISLETDKNFQDVFIGKMMLQKKAD